MLVTPIAGSLLTRNMRLRFRCQLTCGRVGKSSCSPPYSGLTTLVVGPQAEVVNAAPDCLVWKKGVTGITVKIPGLYRFAVGVFTRQVGTTEDGVRERGGLS